MNTEEEAPNLSGRLCRRLLRRTLFDVQGGLHADGDYGCAKCIDPAINFVKIAFTLLAFVVVVCLMVRSALNNATKKNVHSVYIKIFTNHAQMILITASFNLSWPSQVTSLFSAVAPISETSTSIFAFDCFMDPNSGKDLTDLDYKYNFKAPLGEMRIVYQKLIMFAVLPIIIAFVSLTVWSIILKRRNALEHLETRFISRSCHHRLPHPPHYYAVYDRHLQLPGL